MRRQHAGRDRGRRAPDAARRGRARSPLRWPPAARRRGAAGGRSRRDRPRWLIRRPTSVAPPSSTASMRPSRSPSTWSASVGLTRPERLAEGAATGRPTCRQEPCAREDGTVRAGRRCRGPPGQGRRWCSPGAVGTTRVSGPGQNASRQRQRRVVEQALRQRRF